MIILAVAKAGGEIAEPLGQPAVLGELVGGALLGNMVFRIMKILAKLRYNKKIEIMSCYFTPSKRRHSRKFLWFSEISGQWPLNFIRSWHDFEFSCSQGWEIAVFMAHYSFREWVGFLIDVLRIDYIGINRRNILAEHGTKMKHYRCLREKVIYSPSRKLFLEHL